MTLDGSVARKEHGTPRNYRIYKVYGCQSLNFRATILFILRSEMHRVVGALASVVYMCMVPSYGNDNFCQVSELEQLTFICILRLSDLAIISIFSCF